MLKLYGYDQAFVFMKGYCEAAVESNPDVKILKDMLKRFEEIHNELKESKKNGN